MEAITTKFIAHVKQRLDDTRHVYVATFDVGVASCIMRIIQTREGVLRPDKRILGQRLELISRSMLQTLTRLVRAVVAADADGQAQTLWLVGAFVKEAFVEHECSV